MSLLGRRVDMVPREWLDAAIDDAYAARRVADTLAVQLERERERYHALALSVLAGGGGPPAPAGTREGPGRQPSTDGERYPLLMMAEVQTVIPPAVTHAINRVAAGDERLRAHLWQWAALPEQRDRMQTPTGLGQVVDEIVRGKQRSA